MRKSINEDALNVVQKRSEQNEDGDESGLESLKFHLTQSKEDRKKKLRVMQKSWCRRWLIESLSVEV